MKKTLVSMILTAACLAFGVSVINAQKTPDYKIAAIHITPYNQLTGKFEDEIKVGSDRSFFNEVELAAFIVVEVSGKSETSGTNRKVTVTVMEGKKLRRQASDWILISSDGKYFLPVMIEGGICSDLIVTAQITGQKSLSKTVRKVPFACGE